MRIEITAIDLQQGLAGDCFRCAVAMAAARASGDKEARVVEIDWSLRLCVWGRYIELPYDVSRLVRQFDGLDRYESGRVRLPTQRAERWEHDAFDCVRPMSFDVPDDMEDPEWREECDHCGRLVPTADVDDDGYCEDCQESAVPG